MAIPFGLLIIRSGFIPRTLGVWLIINGFTYLATSFTGLILPQLENTVSNVTFPALLGELAVTAWLLVEGANTLKREIRRKVGEGQSS